MAVDQRVTSRAPGPFPPELLRILATASREMAVQTRGDLRARPGDVASRPRTGGTGDVSSLGPCRRSLRRGR